MINVVIIIPTYNEVENISDLIDLIKKIKIKSYKINILIVDDSSPDGTAKIVERKNVKLIINDKKVGLGKAYLIGMEFAINKMNADILIEMDGDFSHNPKYLKKLILNTKYYDMVIGSRYIKGGSIPKNWGIHRKFISYFGNIVIRIMLGLKISDWSTGYRAIKKEVFLKIKESINDEMFFGYTFQIGFLDKAIKSDFKIKEIPINFTNRKTGKSKFGPKYLKNTFLYILKTKIKK